MTELLTGKWPGPAPGAAPLPRMVRAQSALELRTLVRNGEQLLLILVIPVLLLIAFGHENLVSVGSGSRIDFVVPGIMALAVMSTAFTSQAIGTGFERRYGVLKRLGASPLSRPGLIAAKTLTVLAVELAQFAIVLLVGALLGWRPVASPAAVAWVPLLLLAGTAAFSGLALLLAGTLRAEATLAAANLLYLIIARTRRRAVPADEVPGIGSAGAEAAARGRALRRAAHSARACRRPAGPRSARAVRLGGRRDRAGCSHVPVGVIIRARSPLRAAPASLLVFAGIISVQLGAGLAARMFSQAGPAGITGLRLWWSALIMAIFGGRAVARALRAAVADRAWRDLATAVAFGIVLGAMNFSIYQSFARIPLGIAVTIEFLGPLAVAVASSRRPLDLAWVVLAGGGVLLLTQGGGRLTSGASHPAGAAAGQAGPLFGLSTTATGIAFGLVAGGLLGGLYLAQPGNRAAVQRLIRPSDRDDRCGCRRDRAGNNARAARLCGHPGLIAEGLAVGLLSSVIPYRVELEALRRVPAGVFGIWMSLEPAVAALIGLVLLGETLIVRQWLAIAAVDHRLSWGRTVERRSGGAVGRSTATAR